MPWGSAMMPLAPTARVIASIAAAMLRCCSDTSALSHARHVSACRAPSLTRPRLAGEGRVGAARRGAAQPVVDRRAQALLGNGHDGDARELRPVGGAKRGEEIGGGFDEVAGAAQPLHALRAVGRALAEGEKHLAVLHVA